jgi:hypothetical protein
MFMFIRWKRRHNLKSTIRNRDAAASLYCVLLKSERVNQIPKQKIVCYLGRVFEGDTTRECVRVDFWDDAMPKLNALPMSPAERAKIIKSIEAVVPQLPRGQAARFRKERDVALPKMVAFLNGILPASKRSRAHRQRAKAG